MSRIIGVFPVTRLASDRRCRQVQTELADARLVARRQPTVPIVHELTESISATIMNAETAMRWLEHQPPDVEKAQQTINRIVSDGKRAANLIDEFRELAKGALRKGRSLKPTKQSWK